MAMMLDDGVDDVREEYLAAGGGKGGNISLANVGAMIGVTAAGAALALGIGAAGGAVLAAAAGEGAAAAGATAAGGAVLAEGGAAAGTAAAAGGGLSLGGVLSGLGTAAGAAGALGKLAGTAAAMLPGGSAHDGAVVAANVAPPVVAGAFATRGALERFGLWLRDVLGLDGSRLFTIDGVGRRTA